MTSEERAYLAKNAPSELAKMMQVEAEASAFKARLQGCKTKEDTNQAYQNACSSAMGADTAEDLDLSSVMIGQFAAALREVSHKPTKAQLEQQLPQAQKRLDAKD